MEHIVIIESLVGDFEIKTDLPSGKPYVVKWVQDKNTPDVHPTAEVPTVLWYVDEFQKRKKVARENLAQELLKAYPKMLRAVSVKEKPVIEQPIVVDAEKAIFEAEKVPAIVEKKIEPVPERSYPLTRKKKEDTNENS